MPRRTFDDPSSTEARQALLDRRCERLNPKRHRTRKRSIKAREAARLRGLRKAEDNRRRRTLYKAAARAYWAGETMEHPVK
ncbi:MAG: hypothetical protein KGO96_10485 [Elusimicrobia bacterium]|nr:hypothetical protein [Elusimicrobiota bacterium]